MAPILKDLSAGDSTTAPFTPEQEGIDIADLMRGRASLYGLLSRAFRAEVDEDFFDELRAMHYPQNSVACTRSCAMRVRTRSTCCRPTTRGRFLAAGC